MSTTVHELREMLWLDMPKELALAKFLIDRGIDSDNEWVCVVNDTGEIWSFDNSDVRAAKNITIGRRVDKPAGSKEPAPVARRGVPNSTGRMLRKPVEKLDTTPSEVPVIPQDGLVSNLPLSHW